MRWCDREEATAAVAVANEEAIAVAERPGRGAGVDSRLRMHRGRGSTSMRRARASHTSGQVELTASPTENVTECQFKVTLYLLMVFYGAERF